MKITAGFVTSVRTQNQVRRTTNAIAASLQRLSSGQRATSWKQDADGLAIVQKLNAQNRGLTQAALNINQSIGMISTAEGAIETQIEIINRMREIALQSSNGSITNDQRSDLNKEMAALFAEFSSITDGTEYNGQKLLNGGFSQVKLQISSGADSNLNTPYLDMPDLSAAKRFVKTIGNGTFATRTTFSLATTGTTFTGGPQMADLNGDGHLDSVIADSTSGGLNILLGNGAGSFQLASSVGSTVSSSFTLGDINGDGIIDIVTGDSAASTVSIFKGKGDGTFNAATTLSVASSPSAVAIADVNEDGYKDILVTTTAGVALGLGSSSGTYTTGTTVSVGTTPSRIIVADFNKDGNVDFATTNNGSNNVSVKMGAGDGTFSTTATLTTGSGPFAIDAADLNGDGLLDIAVTNASTTTASVFLQSSAGTFASGVNYTIQSASRGIALKDVNGDGYVDMVTAGSSFISTLTGVGNGTFNTKVDVASTNAQTLAVGDLNEDGANDVLSVDISNTLLNIHLGNTQTAAAVTDVDVSTQTKASQLISILDNTLSGLKSEQVRLAGLHSRLDIAAASNLLLSDSYADAKSKIMDPDVAYETADLVKNQMILNAQTAVLAQANVQMQTVMQLLRFN